MKIFLLIILSFLGLVPATAQENRVNIIKKFVYPILLFSNSEIQATGSGFFVSSNSSTYLVTARHILYNNDTSPNKTLEKWRGFSEIRIPIKINGSNKFQMFTLKVAPTDEKVNSIRIADRFSDLIIIRVYVPAQVPVNFVDISVSPSKYLAKGITTYIPGYPIGETEVNIVATKIITNVIALNGRQQEVFLTESDSSPGVSGAPVFTFVPFKKTYRPVFLGMYTGYRINEIKGKRKERGTIINGNILIEWLKTR